MRSKRVTNFARELERVTPALVHRAGGLCELADVSECAGPFHRHHRLRRSHGGGSEIENLLLVCDAHHRLIHDHPLRSYEVGWLVRGVS